MAAISSVELRDRLLETTVSVAASCAHLSAHGKARKFLSKKEFVLPLRISLFGRRSR